jgi:hypothetical protein
MTQELIPMQFQSSFGILFVNEDGTIHEESDFENSWLSEIHKVDIEELDNYYLSQGLDKAQGGDVLEFGWWDKQGNYNEPNKKWRKRSS